MSNTVSFSLPPEVFALLDAQARAKCKSRSEYARDATIAYMTAHPQKGIVAQLVAANATGRKSYELREE